MVWKLEKGQVLEGTVKNITSMGKIQQMFQPRIKLSVFFVGISCAHFPLYHYITSLSINPLWWGLHL